MFGYSLLAVDTLKTIIFAVVGAIGLLAFMIGYVRGLTHTGWGACSWAFATLLWLLFETKIRKNAPIGLFGLEGWVSSLVSLLICMAITLLLVGIIAGLLRPKKRNRDKFAIKLNSDLEEGDTLKVRKNRPCFFNRLCGGLVSLINCVAVFSALAVIVLAIAPAYTDKLEKVYTIGIVNRFREQIERFALDLLFSAIIMAMAYGGWRAGFLRGFRTAIHTTGILVGFSLILFLTYKNVGIIANINAFSLEGTRHLAGKVIKEGSIFERLVPIVAKLGTAGVLSILFYVCFELFCKLLLVLERNAKRSGPVRFINGALGVAATVVQALLLLAIIITVLSFFEYFGANIPLGSWIHEKSVFAGKYITFIRNIIRGGLNSFYYGILI